MANLDILIYPDDRLRNVADPVKNVDEQTRSLVSSMFETMYAAPGIGLAQNTRKVVFLFPESMNRLSVTSRLNLPR